MSAAPAPAPPFVFGFSQFARRLLPLAATAVFLGVAWFDLGSDLNVPALFWHQDWWRQVVTGVAASLLIGYVWLLDAIVAARLSPPAAAAAPPAGWSRVPGHWLLLVLVLAVAVWQFVAAANGAFGAFNADLGAGKAAAAGASNAAALADDARTKWKAVVAAVLHGSAALAVGGLLVVWLLAPPRVHDLLRRPVPKLPLSWWPAVRDYLGNTWVLLSVLLVLPAVFDLGERFWEPLGVAIGFGLAWGVAGLVFLGNRWRRRSHARAAAALSGLGRQALEVLAAALFLSLLAIFLVLMQLPKSWLPPALSVATLFGLLAGVHGALWFYSRKLVPVVALLLAGWYVLCNGQPYRLRFPGLEAEYDAPLMLTADEEPELSAGTDEAARAEAERLIGLCARLQQRLEPRTIDEWANHFRAANPDFDPDFQASEYERLLGEMEARETRALDDWRAYVERQTGRRPILAVVAASGGANRSALWTAVVLHRLEAELADAATPGVSHFPKHLRLVTGASGGMVGAAHYVATLSETGHGGTFTPTDVAKDYLTPVLNATVFREVPRLVWPAATYDRDRGHVLEREMERVTGALGHPFTDLELGERTGWRPSLVFTPMLVEDGRRLIVSNLMLPHQTTSRGAMLLGTRPDGAAAAGPFAQRNPRYPGAAKRGAKQRLAVGRDVYSREAIELFRLFPDARSRLRVSTAARMNASFPYVSPAVELPTDPPRSVVDAGYYDVSGVGVAARWLEHHAAWLAKNTAGVVLIQVRDTRSEYRRRHLFAPEDEPRSELGARLHQSLTWLTGPPSGAAAAQGSVTSFRNDEQLEALSEFFETRRPAGRGLPFFTTVVFERPGDAGMNWYLSRDNVAEIAAGFAPGAGKPNADALDKLKQWWQRRR